MQSFNPSNTSLGNFISNLIPPYEHVSVNKSLQGGFSCQFNTGNRPTFISAPLTNVKTTRISIGTNICIMDISCNPNHPGTLNITNIEIFFYSCGDCEVNITYTNGMQLASMGSPKRPNRSHTPFLNITMRTV